MPVIASKLRIEKLKQLRLSEPIIAMASNEQVNIQFSYYQSAPPFYVYAGAHVPDGPLVIPLWDEGDTVIAVWEKMGALEFIKFSIEQPEYYSILSSTEQGFWAHQFDFLYEADLEIDVLEEIAYVVSFKYLSFYLTEREKVEGTLGTYDVHQQWLKSIVKQIDLKEKV
jgi:hypothetical protein